MLPVNWPSGHTTAAASLVFGLLAEAVLRRRSDRVRAAGA